MFFYHIEELEKRKIRYGFIPFRARVIEEKWKIDVIHANSAYVLCETLAGKLAHVKTIWYLREDINDCFNATFFQSPVL